jgi:hypothetical protein
MRPNTAYTDTLLLLLLAVCYITTAKQYSRTEKRIINARLIMLTFDKNSTDLSYNLTLDYYALDYWGLIKYFVFRREVFWILFAAIGIFSVVLAAVYWVR